MQQAPYDTSKNGKWDPAELRSRLQKTAIGLAAKKRLTATAMAS
ncbi:hypothetical protein [Methanolobus chelungpuianus]|nr:hypothetical protein [Methanolobus chelungpuianus]